MNDLIRVFFVLFLCCNNIIAQSPHFKNYTVKEGLPSNETYETFQDSKGYIWFGTDRGVARFDGYEFKVFNTENGLPDNTVFKFYEDAKGRIWFGSYSGKISFFEHNKITCLRINDDLTKKLKEGLILSMAFYEDTLFVGCSLSNNYFKVLYKDSAQKVFTESTSNYMDAYVRELKNKEYYYGYNYSNNSKNDNYKISFIKNNKIINASKSLIRKEKYDFNIRCKRLTNKNYLISLNNQLLELESKTGKIIKNHVFDHFILSSFQDSEVGIWVGTLKQGVLYFPEGNLNSNPMLYFENISVTNIMEDKEKGMWISSLNDGVFYFPNKKISYYNNNNGLSGNKIRTINTTNQNGLIAGLENGKIVTIIKGKIKNHSTSSDKNSNEFIYNISDGRNGYNLISTTSGLYLFDQTSFSIKCLNIDGKKTPSSFAYNSIKSNTIWVANYGLIFQLNNGSSKKIPFGDKSFTLCEDEKGSLWLGSLQGLWNYKDGNFNFWGDSTKLLKTRINDLKIIDDLFFIASGNSGILIKNEGQIFQITSDSGLLSNNCKSIHIDHLKNIWVSSNKGISKLTVLSWKPFNYRLENYSTKNGLASDEINQITSIDNMVYAATNDGIAVFDMRQLKKNTSLPPIYIKQININDSAFDIKASYELKHNENNIKINYIGLTYKDAGNTNYKYRLLGLDSSWTYTKYTSANFTTLPYGVYTFEVLAQNNDSFWSEKPARINFTIAPPFWHTWWFRLISGISMITGVLYYTRARIKVIEKREMDKTAVFRKTAEMEKEKTELFKKAADLELKFLSSQMNPHFTFNSMNSIQYFLMNNETEKAQRYLVKYSKLIRMVLENNMHNLILLEDEIKTLSLYMQIEALRFTDKFEFEIMLSNELKSSSIKIPPMVIQPFVENAIWHGLMNKNNGIGKIMLNFSVSENMLKCTIEDNGIGRKRAKELSKEKEHQSLGMLISSKRIEKMHTEFLRNKINIIDNLDHLGNPCGTLVELLLPSNI